MDKYEYNLKIDQMRTAVIKRNAEEAARIADEFDWKKEKDASLLISAADAYELHREYRKAKELLITAYEKTPTSKKLAYRLTLLSAKTKDYDEAFEFYHDFVELAPRDTSKYILQYRISKAQGMPVEELIRILEEFVDIEMEEKWMYELAKLYHMAGYVEKCVDLCDEMSLWFSHGKYVTKAMDLKKIYKPLTKRQEENYNKPDEEPAYGEEENDVEGVIEDTGDIQTAVENAASQGDADSDPMTLDEHEKETVKTQATVPFTTMKMQEIRKVLKDATPEFVPENNERHPFAINEDAITVVNNDSEDEDKDDARNEKEQDMALQTQQNIDIEDIKIAPPETYVTDAGDVQQEIADDIKKIMDDDKTGKNDNELTEEVSAKEKLSMTLDPLYKYEANGQIGLNIEEPKAPQKEITGQISIEEVLRNLEHRGILRAETVNQTVEALDNAAAAATKAAVEVAQAIEARRQEETVVEQIEITDLMSEEEKKSAENEIEISEDDSSKGFVFTQEEETSEIQKALEAGAGIAEEEEQEEEDTIELETRPAGSDEDTPVLDLSFDAPVKKLYAGVSRDNEPVAPNTASLQEIFSDLDEATKRELGLLEPESESGNRENDNAAGESREENAKQDMTEENTKEGTTEEDDRQGATEEDAKQGATEEDAKHGVIQEDAQEGPTEMDDDVTGQNEAAHEDSVENEPSDEPDAIEEAEGQSERQEGLETDETVGESADSGTNAGPVTNSVTIEENEFKQTKDMETEQSERMELNDMPQVTVSTNEKLSETKPLNLEKVVVTDEEMVPFESFRTVSGLEQKIKDTVIELSIKYVNDGNSKDGNIMILGDDKSGKTTMAIELIKLINKKRERVGRRIAKVDSSVLNTRGIRSSMKKLIGSDLIVENAQYLRASVLEEFVSIGKYYTDDMLMVFEGETSAMKTMRSENPEIARMFDNMLVIKEYDVKEWVAYAKKYAADKNYMIDEMGILALYKAIDDFYGKHQGIEQSDVENIINHAIKKASKKISRKITNLFSAKNDENGMDILKEADFK